MQSSIEPAGPFGPPRLPLEGEHFVSDGHGIGWVAEDVPASMFATEQGDKTVRVYLARGIKSDDSRVERSRHEALALQADEVFVDTVLHLDGFHVSRLPPRSSSRQTIQLASKPGSVSPGRS